MSMFCRVLKLYEPMVNKTDTITSLSPALPPPIFPSPFGPWTFTSEDLCLQGPGTGAKLGVPECVLEINICENEGGGSAGLTEVIESVLFTTCVSGRRSTHLYPYT